VAESPDGSATPASQPDTAPAADVTPALHNAPEQHGLATVAELELPPLPPIPAIPNTAAETDAADIVVKQSPVVVPVAPPVAASRSPIASTEALVQVTAKQPVHD
jgi:hypothetical protein